MNRMMAQDNLTDLIHRVASGKERIIVNGTGGEAAVLIPVEDLRLLEELEDRIDLEDALEALREPGSIPWEQVKKELDL